ncbi:MAG: lipoprotein insertase outer membrane protein LolB [Gammaproteobacteria bacterium]|nr:lipoprotein insertase outer membrane protein LolB [Gammaproteobacteria bacterium]MCW9005054.1 lipoprotein insertase outer membrane protein LolB [Gammaproteobacteria bacterium]
MLLMAVMLSACAPPKKISLTPPNEQQWQQHQQQVSAIHQWNISGRMAIETADNGGQVDIFWQQEKNDIYDIRMIAPFGGGTSVLTSRPEGVTFTNGNGEQIVEQNADRLMERIEGWRFPVSGLRYWILGVPAPHNNARLINWNEQGYLNIMEQDGWRIEMLNYKQVGRYTLPKKIFISRLDRDDLSVRMVIRKWGFTD